MKKNIITILKIGGKIISDRQKCAAALESFAALREQKILVHGGGAGLNDRLLRMGIEPRMVNGRRITDDKTLEAALMVYAGLENKKIVAALQAVRCPAVGLSGADGDMIRAEKRAVGETDYGWAGDIKRVNSGNLIKLLQAGFVPVFCALTHDGRGQMLNTNADTIAAALAAALSVSYRTRLVYAFEKNGVLRDPAKENTIIKEIDPAMYRRLKKEKVVGDGMLPKLDNAFWALRKGAAEVRIVHYDRITNRNEGTRVIWP